MSTRFGRWIYDEEAFQLVHDNGLLHIDLYQCVGEIEIADLVFHVADKPIDEEDVGHLVRAFRALFPVRDWINGSLDKQRAELRAVTLTDEQRSRLH